MYHVLQDKAGLWDETAGPLREVQLEINFSQQACTLQM